MNNLEKAIFLSKMRENVLGKLNDGSIPPSLPSNAMNIPDLPTEGHMGKEALMGMRDLALDRLQPRRTGNPENLPDDEMRYRAMNPSLMYEPPEMSMGEVDPMGGKMLKGIAKGGKKAWGTGKKTIKELVPARPGVQIQPQMNLGTEKVLHPSEKWGEGLSKESQTAYNAYGNRLRGKSAIHSNDKTGLSVDFSTTCPKRGCADGACPYCYVEAGRAMKKVFNQPMANKGLTENDYAGEITGWGDDMVQKLNKDGGLRMFSFGDFRPGIDEKNVMGVLKDAKKKGLYIKAITKQPEFVKLYRDHPNMRINISVDNVPRRISKNAPTIAAAKKLQGGRENVKIRAVALNKMEAEDYAKHADIDVVTAYHGMTNFDPKGVRHNKLMKIIESQNPQLVEKVGYKKLQAYTDTWENLKKPKWSKEMHKKYPGKFCCESGKCRGDKTKCGFGLGGAGLILGVRLADFEEEQEEN